MVLHPEGPGFVLAILSIILLVFSWITVIMRTLVRIKIRAFGTDDWLMATGLVLFTLACASTLLGALNGVGAHSDRLNDYYQKQGRKWFMFFQLFYVASTVPIKASICVALLRITMKRTYKWPLYGVIFLAVVAAITTDVAVLAQCQPVAATWDKSLGHCADPAVVTGVSFFISAVSILTDWTCAILPAFILWDVQLHTRIKAPVMIVLALGVVASTATLVRLKYLLNYSNPADYLYGIADIAIWSITESGTGIIAGSLATLRPILKKIPFFFDSRYDSRSKSASKSRANLSRSHNTLSHKMNVLRSGTVDTRCESNRQNWEELSDGASQKYILKDTNIVVTSEGASMHGDLNNSRSWIEDRV